MKNKIILIGGLTVAGIGLATTIAVRKHRRKKKEKNCCDDCCCADYRAGCDMCKSSDEAQTDSNALSQSTENDDSELRCRIQILSKEGYGIQTVQQKTGCDESTVVNCMALAAFENPFVNFTEIKCDMHTRATVCEFKDGTVYSHAVVRPSVGAKETDAWIKFTGKDFAEVCACFMGWGAKL
jgi:hypothetical protein